MKRFLIFAASVVVSFFAVAQQNTSIEIDPSSFKPVQTSAISGVAIDKIQPDLSRRPCARIKMHINRMSREDIASLSVKTVGGNVVVMKSVVASEGNGLIIELTAKPQTRFYLHHDKYGDSNEVVLDLEGEKEYKLEAELSLLQSIVVSTNVVGADVYIDNDFKGQTGSSMALTVNDMTHGIHDLRVSYGVAKSERQIEVSGSNIHFRIDVDSSLSRPQYVVFVVQPKSASVVIEGKTLLPDADGVVTTVLNSGSYNYLVTAKEHHDEKGTFVVSGSKVQKSVILRPAYGWLSVPSKGVLVGASVFVDNGFVGQTPVAEHKLSSGTHRVRVVKEMYRAHEEDIVVEDNKRVEYAPTLVADCASVTIDAGGSYDIYVNNELKGESPWSGNLATGAYIFEARKTGHRTTSLSKTISATPAQQRYTLPAPIPIVGTLNVTSTPAMAEVYVDGTKAGETPLMRDIATGKHKITLHKEGYYPAEQTVTIEDGKVTEVSVLMPEESATSGGRSRRINPEYHKRQTGFGSLIDILYAMDLNTPFSSVGLTYTAGYRFNNHIYLGAGVGANVNFGAGMAERHVGNNHDMRFLTPCRISIPVFAYFRANFINRRCSPFFALSAGGNFSTKQTVNFDLWSARYSTIGMFVNPQIGVNVRTTVKTSAYFAIGFPCRTAPYCTEFTLYNATIKQGFVYGVDAHIGFTF